MEEIKTKIEQELERLISSDTLNYLPHISTQNLEIVNNPLRELINRGGKRLRPIITFLNAQSYNPKEIKSLKLTPIPEIIHNSTLIADDIEDQSDERRGQPAIHIIHGIDNALNSSNWGYFIVSQLIDDNNQLDISQKNSLNREYHKVMQYIHLGQALDIHWHNHLNIFPSIEEYRNMAILKTGSLISFSSIIGLIANDAPLSKIEEVRVIWQKVGLAFQMIDDIINLKIGNPGKIQGDDLTEGKKSLPLILFCDKFPKEKEFIFQSLQEIQKNRDKQQIDNLITLIKERNILNKSEEIAIQIIQEAQASLEKIYAPSKEKDSLLLIIYKIKESLG